MSRSLTVSRAAPEQKNLVINLMQFYLYDFTEFVSVERNDDGLFCYPYLNHYWQEPDRHPFLISVDSEPAGFALVREVLNPETNEIAFDMAEFFVMKMFRRQNVGNEAVQTLCASMQGNWLVRVMGNNHRAYHFWKSALNGFDTTHTTQSPGSNHLFTFSTLGA
ncbi:MAG: putative acetyltransferase [Candidatus Azotimanducaceae bacterium]|jgi:predicted acetyltransferase